ncbi:hypothetical protein DFH09DRAFT_1153226 [Mycena vulgaris]|nr:hypothetical protein DFH09DRAFT_1153226 [Mycena vulgaris]
MKQPGVRDPDADSVRALLCCFLFFFIIPSTARGISRTGVPSAGPAPATLLCARRLSISMRIRRSRDAGAPSRRGTTTRRALRIPNGVTTESMHAGAVLAATGESASSGLTQLTVVRVASGWRGRLYVGDGSCDTVASGRTSTCLPPDLRRANTACSSLNCPTPSFPFCCFSSPGAAPRGTVCIRVFSSSRRASCELALICTTRTRRCVLLPWMRGTFRSTFISTIVLRCAALGAGAASVSAVTDAADSTASEVWVPMLARAAGTMGGEGLGTRGEWRPLSAYPWLAGRAWGTTGQRQPRPACPYRRGPRV